MAGPDLPIAEFCRHARIRFPQSKGPRQASSIRCAADRPLRNIHRRPRAAALRIGHDDPHDGLRHRIGDIRYRIAGVRERLAGLGLPEADIAGLGLQVLVQGGLRRRITVTPPTGAATAVCGRRHDGRRVVHGLPIEKQAARGRLVSDPLQIRLDAAQSARQVVKSRLVAPQVRYQTLAVSDRRGDRPRGGHGQRSLQLAHALARADQIILSTINMRLDVTDRRRRCRDIRWRRIQMSINRHNHCPPKNKRLTRHSQKDSIPPADMVSTTETSNSI